MGVKCSVKRGWRISQRWIDGVLWVEEFVEHDMHVEVRRHGGIDQLEEATELLGPMPRRHLGEHLPGGDVERC